MFVLDVLRHDEIENVPSLVKMLNNDGCIGWRDQWHRDFTDEDVRCVLGPMVRDRLVLALREKTDSDGFDEIDETDLSGGDVWFHLTDKGREVWEAWQPPPEPAAVTS